MKLFVFRLLFLLLFAGAAPFVHSDSGARVVKYSDSDIIPIRAKVRFSTLIVLPADEEILDFTTGDKDFWIINGVHNLCYLHPGQPGSLDQFHSTVRGLDQQGATALKDKVNNHYTRIFGASLALGVLGSAAQVGTGSALEANGADRIREGFSAGLATAGEQVLERFLNILPTVTIREGTRVKIYLSGDLLLPDYHTHSLPSDI